MSRYGIRAGELGSAGGMAPSIRTALRPGSTRLVLGKGVFGRRPAHLVPSAGANKWGPGFMFRFAANSSATPPPRRWACPGRYSVAFRNSWAKGIHLRPWEHVCSWHDLWKAAGGLSGPKAVLLPDLVGGKGSEGRTPVGSRSTGCGFHDLEAGAFSLEDEFALGAFAGIDVPYAGHPVFPLIRRPGLFLRRRRHLLIVYPEGLAPSDSRGQVP